MPGKIIFGTYFTKDMIESSVNISHMLGKYRAWLFTELMFVKCPYLDLAYVGKCVCNIESVDDISSAYSQDRLSLDDRLNSLVMVKRIPCELREVLPLADLYVVGCSLVSDRPRPKNLVENANYRKIGYLHDSDVVDVYTDTLKL